MAVTLSFLRKTAGGCAQHMLAASPKVAAASPKSFGALTPKSFLGAATPKTPATPAMSPFASASPFFISELETPFRLAEASCQLVRLALPSAQAAHQHAMARRQRRAAVPADADEPRPLPALIRSAGQHCESAPAAPAPAAARGARRLRFEDELPEAPALALPVMLGRPRHVATAEAPTDSPAAATQEGAARRAAEAARLTFLARRRAGAERQRCAFP